MRFRSAFLTAAATVAAFAMAGVASAHEELSPKTFPTGQPAFLTLTAANEASADLVRIALRAPAGLPFGAATRSPAGWSAASTGTAITWTGGTVKPRTFESFGFEVEGADQPATLTYTVTLGYAGGKTDDHEVEVTAAAPGTGGAGTSGSPAATVTTAAATSAPPATPGAPAGSAGDSATDSGAAKAALPISLLALLVAAAALVTGARRGGRPGTNGASGGGTAAGAAQDW